MFTLDRHSMIHLLFSLAPSTSSLSIAMDSTQARVSPPKVIVDSSSLQTAIDKNRECKRIFSTSMRWVGTVIKCFCFLFPRSAKSKTVGEKICKPISRTKHFAS